MMLIERGGGGGEGGEEGGGGEVETHHRDSNCATLSHLSRSIDHPFTVVSV